MDEEDGRLGPRARKFGRFDVLTDAIAGSLCQPLCDPKAPFQPLVPQSSAFLRPNDLSQSINTHCRALSRAENLPKASALPQVKEKQYENVPGK
jgi:hypothetical protein